MKDIYPQLFIYLAAFGLLDLVIHEFKIKTRHVLIIYFSGHGYPNNFAQLIYSPMVFRIQPMQIDTRNRNPQYINDSEAYYLYHKAIYFYQLQFL